LTNDANREHKMVVTQESKGTPAYHTGLAKMENQCSAEAFAAILRRVLRINICGEKPPLRQYANRYLQ
jgi:hypothetical protein